MNKGIASFIFRTPLKRAGCDTLTTSWPLIVRFICLFLAGAALVFAEGCASHSAQTLQPLPARFVHLKGQARWRNDGPDKSWHVVKAGVKVAPGTVVETAKDSRVEVVLSPAAGTTTKSTIVDRASSLNRTAAQQPMSTPPPPPLRIFCGYGKPMSFPSGEGAIRVWENSRLMFQQLTRSTAFNSPDQIHNVRLDLQAGHIFFTVHKLPADAQFEVTGPDFKASVRGGTCDLDVDGIVKVLNGSVLLTYDHGRRTQVILGQQMFDARTGVLSDLPQYDKIGMPLLLENSL